MSNQNGLDLIRLTIHQSSDSLCLARAVHRSGRVPRSISRGDLLYDTTGRVAVGRIASATADHVQPEWWVYNVEYQPADGTPQAIWDTVTHRVPEQPTEKERVDELREFSNSIKKPSKAGTVRAPDQAADVDARAGQRVPAVATTAPAIAANEPKKQRTTGRASKRAANPPGQQPAAIPEADSQVAPEPEASVF